MDRGPYPALREFDDYVLSTYDATVPGNLRFLLQVYPDLVFRRLSHLLITPLRQAIRDGPLALTRYFFDVARRAMRPSR